MTPTHIQSINPATEEVIYSYNTLSAQEMQSRLAKMQKAQIDWRNQPFPARVNLMRNAASQLRANKTEFSNIIIAEMGKPITEAEAEIEKCAFACNYYAENAEGFLRSAPRVSGASESYIQYDPIGIVLAVMPWNFPFWQVFRFAAPALMAGNGTILKHASNVPRCALAIERIFREAGFPDGIFQTLLVAGSEVHRLIEHPAISAVTLTGSEAAGRQVAACAGRMLKKTVLELGGSDPFIVLADADLDLAIQMAVRARFQNTGQSCIAAKRFIVVDSVFERFQEGFVETVKALNVGNPVDRATQIGPLARAEFLGDLERQIGQSVKMGASILTGGRRRSGKGFYFEPTVLTNVNPDMPAGCEEMFGPAAALMRAANPDEAIDLANKTKFGLGSSIWTKNIDAARQLATKIEAGQIFINGMVASDPRLPFGGVKSSGYGRELSELGIREFMNIKTVWIGPPKQ